MCPCQTILHSGPAYAIQSNTAHAYIKKESRLIYVSMEYGNTKYLISKAISEYKKQRGK